MIQQEENLLPETLKTQNRAISTTMMGIILYLYYLLGVVLGLMIGLWWGYGLK